MWTFISHILREKNVAIETLRSPKNRDIHFNLDHSNCPPTNDAYYRNDPMKHDLNLWMFFSRTYKEIVNFDRSIDI